MTEQETTRRGDGMPILLCRPDGHIMSKHETVAEAQTVAAFSLGEEGMTVMWGRTGVCHWIGQVDGAERFHILGEMTAAGELVDMTDALLESATGHKSDCLIHDAPALRGEAAPLGPCTCKPALHVGVTKSNDKFGSIQHWNRLATSWQANLLVELVKTHLVNPTVPVPASNPDGSQQLRRMTNEEIMASSCYLADSIILEMERRRWVSELPSLDELREEDDAPAGFMAPGRKV